MEAILKTSVKTNEAKKKVEEHQFELEFKAKLDEAMKREKKYNSNFHKAYTDLWERYSKAMKLKIESQAGYETTICNNPIKLLEAIKEHSLNYEESRYDMRIIVDAFNAYFNCKQKEKESLQDYTKCFKTARDVLHSHLG